MKKLVFAAVVAVAAVAFTSCGNGTPKANLKTDIDSLSYAIGINQSDGLKQYLIERMGIDSAYIDEVIKGINDGATAGDDKKKAAYMLGLSIGQQLGTQLFPGANQELFGNDSTKTLSMKNFLAGFVSGLKGDTPLMTHEQAAMMFQTKMQQLHEEALNKQYGEYKKRNEAWLKANAKNPGVVTLPSGLQYKVITEGTGEKPSATDTVVVNYQGQNIDGQQFDSSYERGEPATFAVNGVVPGWVEALQLMPVGSKWEVYVPAELGYGAREMSEVIKPYSTLVFTLELVGIKK